MSACLRASADAPGSKIYISRQIERLAWRMAASISAIAWSPVVIQRNGEFESMLAGWEDRRKFEI
jgi:hypothetical protein